MLPWILIAVSLAAGLDIPDQVARKGITAAEYQTLRNSRILTGALEDSATPSCGHADPLPFAEKFILSDRVVRGEIIAIEYLYKEGGPFRTLYTLKVHESLKGA